MRKFVSLLLLLVGLLAMSGLASAQELVKVPRGAGERPAGRSSLLFSEYNVRKLTAIQFRLRLKLR